jgi:hypothetical protein
VKGKLMQAAPYAAAAASYTAAISIVAAPSLGVYAGAKKEWDEQLRNCPTGVLGHDVLLNEDQPQGARRFDPVNPKSHLKGLIGGSVTGAIIGSAVSVGLVHRSLDNEYALSPALALGGVLCASASSALISFGSKELFVEKYEKTGEIAFDGEPIQKKIPLRCAKSGEVPTSKT